MVTKRLQVNRENPDTSMLSAAATALRQGGLVAFPTETVYGLGANALDESAVRKIYEAKGRPSDNPLIVHVADVEEISKFAQAVPRNAEVLMHKYWPGPLTVIVKRTNIVPDITTGGLDTVALRLPASVVARQLIRLAGVPVAAPSANLSGRPSPTCAQDVLADLDGRIEYIIDAGPSNIGVESTIVDCTTPVPTLLRPGGITLEMLLDTLGEVEVDPALGGEDCVPKAPGMKYRHYAPLAPMVLFEGKTSEVVQAIKEKISAAVAEGKQVGAVVSAETAQELDKGVTVAVYGPREQPEITAANLYTVLRYFDDKAVNLIVAEGISETGLGLAVMNRLRKAAGYNIIHIA